MNFSKRPTTLLIVAAVLVSASVGACSSAGTGEDVKTAESPLSDDDVCKDHRDLLQAALENNAGNVDDVDNFGSINHGRKAFNDRKLSGLGANGRACADCHQANDAFQLSPASATARKVALDKCRTKDANADDPLFRPIDADDPTAANPTYNNLTKNGLIRITFPLPPNIKLTAGPTGPVLPDTTVDVWRMVPTVYNVKLTGPDPHPRGAPYLDFWPRGDNRTGGYQLDSRVATLQDQAKGAIMGHAQAGSEPSQSFLDEIALFENQLFSSDGVKAMSDAIDQGAAPVDPDPVLTDEEAAGKVVFQRACAQCHGGPGQVNPGGGPGANALTRFGSVQAQCPRPVDGPNFPGYTGTPRWNFAQCSPSLAPNIRWFQITRPNGEITRRPSSDPGRTLLTGFASLGPFPLAPSSPCDAVYTIPAPGPPGRCYSPAQMTGLVTPPNDDWLALDVPQVRNVSKTAPYFHNNSAADLDALLDHYEQFFKFVAGTAPPAPAPVPAPLTTDPYLGPTGPRQQINRPFTAAERGPLKAYLMKL